MRSAEGELNKEKMAVDYHVTARQLTSIIKRKIFLQITIKISF